MWKAAYTAPKNTPVLLFCRVGTRKNPHAEFVFSEWVVITAVRVNDRWETFPATPNSIAPRLKARLWAPVPQPETPVAVTVPQECSDLRKANYSDMKRNGWIPARTPPKVQMVVREMLKSMAGYGPYMERIRPVLAGRLPPNVLAWKPAN